MATGYMGVDELKAAWRKIAAEDHYIADALGWYWEEKIQEYIETVSRSSIFLVEKEKQLLEEIPTRVFLQYLQGAYHDYLDLLKEALGMGEALALIRNTSPIKYSFTILTELERILQVRLKTILVPLKISFWRVQVLKEALCKQPL